MNKQLFKVQIFLRVLQGTEQSLIDAIPVVREALRIKGIEFVSLSSSPIFLEEPDRDYNHLNSSYPIPDSCSYEDLPAVRKSVASPESNDDTVPLDETNITRLKGNMHE